MFLESLLKSSVILGKCLAYGQFSKNLRKSSESARKCSKIVKNVLISMIACRYGIFVFPAKAEYSYFSADFRLKIFL